MTEKLLRDSLIEAQGKGEIGLFIWANWRVWDDLAFEMKEGDEKYDFAISQVLKQEEATISTSPHILASLIAAVDQVPVFT